MKIYIFLFLLLLSNIVFGQQNNFSIEARVHYIPNNDYAYTSEFTSFVTREIVPDSLWERTTFSNTLGRKNNYKIHLGAELLGHLNFNLSNRLSLKTGLGISLISFTRSIESAGVLIPIQGEAIISVDTLTSNSTVINFNNNCDEIVNTNKTGNNLNNLQWGLSGNVKYQLSNNWGVKLGIQKDMNNVFLTRDESQFLFIEEDNLNPIKLFFGIEYQFTKKKK